MGFGSESSPFRPPYVEGPGELSDHPNYRAQKQVSGEGCGFLVYPNEDLGKRLDGVGS